MPDDLTPMFDALADDAGAVARLGTAADIRRRARRQGRRVFLSVGTLTACGAALVVAAVSTLADGTYGPATYHPAAGPTASSAPTSSQSSTTGQSVPPDPATYHAQAWLPATDSPMASQYQWTFTAPADNGGAMSTAGLGVTPICGSQYVGSNTIEGAAQVGTFLPSAGNGGWSSVTEMLYFLPSAQDAATTYSRLLPDPGKCLGGASGFSGTDLSAGFTAHTTNGFGWYQRYQFQADGTTPRMAADYVLVARHGSVIAVFSAIAAWAPSGQGPTYDTSGDQQALNSLAAHLAAYTDLTSSASASGS